jgi:muramoyltetrapeptide carboxypeptidase
MITPPYLNPGDCIRIVSPAKAIEKQLILDAKNWWENQSYVVEIGQNAYNELGYFAGSDEERLADFQAALDDPNVKAIVCSRGGYGCIRLLEQLDWSSFYAAPKWIIGFSDVTVFHLFLQAKGYQSIHATMPLNYGQNSDAALATLASAVRGSEVSKTITTTFGQDASIVGGNLSIVYSLLGTPYLPNFNGKILFIEDLSEQLYHLDRMFFALKMSGVLSSIKGLIVGGMTDMKDTLAPTNFTVQSIIAFHTSDLGIPVIFDFPAGHIDDNQAIVLG